MKQPISDLQKDYLILKENVLAMSHLSSRRTRLHITTAVCILLFLISIYLQDQFLWLSIFIASIAGITLVWLIHDAGHDSYFSNKSDSKMFIETMGILFLGMPQVEYHYEVHRRHHGFTNVIGKDGALNTGPILWHPNMCSEVKKPLKYQQWIWFLVVLPLTWLLITGRCVQTLVQRKAFLRLSFFFARWILVLWLFNFNLLFVFLPILITGFVLGFSASLNHFHMTMKSTPIAQFPESVFLTTQNLSHRSSLMTWLTGGLNFHIEHHLFPNLPNYQLPIIAPLVQKFAQKHHLPYQTCSLVTATRLVFDRLANPLLTRRIREKAT